jgi:hypothetical protein
MKMRLLFLAARVRAMAKNGNQEGCMVRVDLVGWMRLARLVNLCCAQQTGKCH